MIDLPLYHVTLTRDSLNDLMTVFSASDRINIHVNEQGEVSFNIPKESGLSVNQINIVNDLFSESEVIDKKQKKLKKDGKRWMELEVEKQLCINCAVKVMKVLKKYYDGAIID